MNRSGCWLGIFIVVAGFSALSVAAEPPDKGAKPFRLNALLVSLEDYQGAELNYAKNDLDRLSEVLAYDFGCTTKLVHNRSVVEDFESDAPDRLKTSIEREIVAWRDSLSPDDLALLYLAGHGVQDDSGKLYFPMLDFQQSDRPFEDAAIPVAWIRDVFQEADCKSRLVLIDACYSGTSRSVLADSAAAKLIETFDAADGRSCVATIASSDKSQKSWLWIQEKHSLFTYWLIEAFSGTADLDQDGAIRLDELFDYLRDNVSRVSRNDSTMKEQTPVLLGDARESRFELPRPARKINEAIRRTFVSVDRRLRDLKLLSVLVTPEFKTGLDDEIDSSAYGTLPGNIADDFRTALALDDENNEKPYNVLQKEQTKRLLEQSGLSPADVGTDRDRTLLDDEKIDATIDGRIRMLTDRTLLLNVTLKNLRNGRCYEYSSKIFLTPNEIAAQGIAFQLPKSNSDDSFVATEDGVVERSVWETTGEILAQQESGYNPTSDDSLPFTVEIRVRPGGSRDKFRTRNGKIKDGVFYLPLQSNEEFAIYIRNEDVENEFYYVAALVDGLNTISQRLPVVSSNLETTKDLYVRPAGNSKGDQVLAPRVDLEQARRWLVFKPGSPKGNELTIEGFCNEQGQNSKGYRFLLGDADESLAARRNYVDQIGLITIAFFEPTLDQKRRKIDGPLGVRPGQEFDIKLQTEETNPSRLKVVYQIRYVSQQTFDEMFGK